MALVEIGSTQNIPETVGQELRVLLRSKSTATSFFYPVPCIALMITGVVYGQFPILGLLALAPFSLITPASIWLEAKVNYMEMSRHRKARERQKERAQKEAMELAALSSRHAITDLMNHPISEGDLALALGALARAADAWDDQPVQASDSSRKKLQSALERVSKSCAMVLEDPNLMVTEADYYEMVDSVMSMANRLEATMRRFPALQAPTLVIDNHNAPPVQAPTRIAA